MTYSWHLTVIFIFVFIISSCSSYSDWDRDGLNGKVKSYTQKSYDAEKKFGEWQKTNLLDGNRQTWYNKKGNIQKVHHFDEEGELAAKAIFKYNDNNFYKSSVYNDEGNFQYDWIQTEDSGNLRKNIIVNNNDDTVSTIHEYYQDGRVIKRLSIDKSSPEDTSKIFLEYNSGEKLTTIKSSRFENKFYEYLEYDEKDNWKKRIEYNFKEDTTKKEFNEMTVREYSYY